MSLATLLSIALTLFGVATTAIGTWIALRSHYRQVLHDKQQVIHDQQISVERLIQEKSAAATKEYAAQRDFEHLKRNQDQMREAIKMVQDENREQQDLLIELKVSFRAMYNRIEQIAAQLSGNRTLGGPPPNDD